MEIICDTSFLMVLCYEPVKNIDFLASKFGKATFLVHPKVVKELTQIKLHGNIKRSKIANLALEVINKETENNNFRYLVDNESKSLLYGVDSYLLTLSLKKKCPLATIDKILMRRALSSGADIITLKNNKILFLHSNIRSNQT
jgi:rRNA-processing protein FCF1